MLLASPVFLGTTRKGSAWRRASPSNATSGLRIAPISDSTASLAQKSKARGALIAAGVIRLRCRLADYYALMAYAAATLEKNPAASRRALYERARTILVAQMRKLDPPLTESAIRREQFALEEAIRKLEAEKLSRLAQRDDRLIGKINELVNKTHQMPLRRSPVTSDTTILRR